MHSIGTFVEYIFLYLHSNKASLFYKVICSIFSKCLAAPTGNPRFAYFDSNKYSIGDIICNISIIFDYNVT